MKTYEYENNGTTITQPGKFEGEPVFAPHFWQLGLEGFADSDNGNVYSFRFDKDDKEFAEWPTLKEWLGRRRVLRMREDSAGFVRCF